MEPAASFVDHHAHFLTLAAGYVWPSPRTWFPELASRRSNPMDEPWPERCEPSLLTSVVAKALDLAASLGLVAITEMGIPDISTFDALRRLREQESLPVDVDVYLSSGLARSLGPSDVTLLRTGDHTIDVVGIKFYADGWLSLRNCAVREPFSGSNDIGILFLDAETLARRATPFAERGFRIATHAIGDRAIEAVLDAYDTIWDGDHLACREAAPRIEHGVMLTRDLMQRAAEMGVVVCFQPGFPSEDNGAAQQALGSRRAGLLYDWSSALHTGVRLIAGSDAPMANASPHWSLAQLTDATLPHHQIFPGALLSREQAIGTMTRTDVTTRLVHHPKTAQYVLSGNDRRIEQPAAASPH